MRQQPRPDTAVTGLSRCPFCHDAIRAADEAWVACERCLARHHEPCWAEGAGCGSCAAQAALERPVRTRRRELVAPLMLVVGLGVGWILGLRFEALRRAVMAEPVATHVDGPAPEPARSPGPPRELPSYVYERLDFMIAEDRLEDAERYALEKLEEYPDAAPELLREYMRRRAPH